MSSDRGHSAGKKRAFLEMPGNMAFEEAPFPAVAGREERSRERGLRITGFAKIVARCRVGAGFIPARLTGSPTTGGDKPRPYSRLFVHPAMPEGKRPCISSLF